MSTSRQQLQRPNKFSIRLGDTGYFYLYLPAALAELLEQHEAWMAGAVPARRVTYMDVRIKQDEARKSISTPDAGKCPGCIQREFIRLTRKENR